MSAELRPVSGLPGGPQGTVLGGAKPLHRFLKAQPKAIGTVMVVLGASMIILTVSSMGVHIFYASIPPTLVSGALFIISGILYILAEHNPTKKTVTISLAMSIISILGACWTNLRIMPHMEPLHDFRRYDITDYDENGITEIESSSHYPLHYMITTYSAVLVFYCFLGAIIVLVMSIMAGAALRSTKSQAIVVMTSTQAEAPVE